MERLLKALGHPEARVPPVIHIAGTNGKGSVTAYLKGMLQAEGLRVHAYTSPHLVSFRERIELGGQPIAEAVLAELLEEVERVNAGEPITFFEITTAAAFLAFAREPADVLLLEVGLGGRLDATNVIDAPRVTVITPVSMDHQEFLGATLGQIASEKAGILKKDCVAVIGPQLPDAEAAIDAAARQVDAPLRLYGTDFIAHEEQGRLIYQDTDGLMDLPLPRLEGRHQFENAAVAIAAAKAFFGHALAPETVAAGLRTVNWPGRLQRLKEGPLVAAAGEPEGEAPDIWVDGGHNPAAAAVIAQAMADLDERLSRPLYLVVAMGANKDASGFFSHFKGLARRVIAIPMPAGHEGHEPRALAAMASEAGMAAGVAANPADAIGQALADAGADEPPRILITGSLYLIGEILRDNA
jgi:dihydrofolate synthase/folylpolyglutamate synthase